MPAFNTLQRKMMKIRSKFNSEIMNPFSGLRNMSKLLANPKDSADNKMLAWQIHCYAENNEPHLSKMRTPILTSPSELLIRVDASSVNPIDIAMSGGYGSTIFNCLRKVKSIGGRPCSDIEFPLILGRDFSGTVVAKGHGVNNLKVGDEVWGVIPIEEQGCHADFVMADSSLVNLRPQHLSHTEAAGILYAGLTAWSSLWYTGGLFYKLYCSTHKPMRVLVLGGSGGVGSLAIQLLKAWGIQVITTCSSDATNLMEKLGADVIVDYNLTNATSKIISEGPYEIILDCCNQGAANVHLKGYPHHTYITLNSPALKNYDKHGLVLGTMKNIGDLLQDNIPTTTKLRWVKWGYFFPSSDGLNVIQELVENKQIVPVVDEVFSFEDLPKAYNRMREGHLRGKIIIDMR